MSNRPAPVSRRPAFPRPPARRWLLTPGVLLGAVLLVAAAVRLFAFLPTLDDPYLEFRQGDEEFYHRWALDILGGSWSRAPAFHTTPLYAYFLALAYAVGGQAIPYVRLLNVLMGLGAAGLVALTARLLLGPRAAVLATLLYALCTVPIFYEWLPEKTSLTLLLTALSFFLIARATERDAPGRWVVAGIAVALAALAHATLLVLVPGVWLHVALGGAGTRAARVNAIAGFTLGALLGILPATIHNYAKSGDFVLISYNLGTTLPLLVPLSILAAQAPAAVSGLLRRRRWAALFALGAAAGAAGAGGWFVFGPVLPGSPVSHFIDYNNQGNRYLDLGRFDLAIAEFDKALTVEPGRHASVPRLFGWLVRQYTARGQAARAEDLFRRVLARYPDDAEARQLLTQEYRASRLAAAPP